MIEYSLDEATGVVTVKGPNGERRQIKPKAAIELRDLAELAAHSTGVPDFCERLGRISPANEG